MLKGGWHALFNDTNHTTIPNDSMHVVVCEGKLLLIIYYFSLTTLT